MKTSISPSAFRSNAHHSLLAWFMQHSLFQQLRVYCCTRNGTLTRRNIKRTREVLEFAFVVTSSGPPNQIHVQKDERGLHIYKYKQYSNLVEQQANINTRVMRRMNFLGTRHPVQFIQVDVRWYSTIDQYYLVNSTASEY